jgi:hypothetical protein
MAKAKRSASSNNKTQRTEASVEQYLADIADEDRREDCQKLTGLMTAVTGEKPRMWGASIVGFGSYHYKYDSGREGDMCLAGFSARKDAISVYVLVDTPAQKQLLAKLGKHRASEATCVYLKRLSDVDHEVLKQVIAGSVTEIRRRYG